MVVGSSFFAIIAMCVLPSIVSSKCGRDSVCAHMQLSLVYLVSTLDVMHVMKCTRLSTSLVGKAWKLG